MTHARPTSAMDRHDFLRGLAVLAALALAPSARAEGGTHAGHAAGGTPSTAAYREANARMHSAMDIAYTGNADVDFVRGMIPHHQGAIDMAKVVLEHGEDPELRLLAEEVIATQEAEIAFLTAWLERNGG